MRLQFTVCRHIIRPVPVTTPRTEPANITEIERPTACRDCEIGNMPKQRQLRELQERIAAIREGRCRLAEDGDVLLREPVELVYGSLAAYTQYQETRPFLEPAEVNDDPLVETAGWAYFKLDLAYAINRYRTKYIAVQNQISQSGEVERRIEEIRERGTWCQKIDQGL